MNTVKIVPREYQLKAHDAVFKEWKDKQSTLLEMATGTGKTIVFSMILQTLAAQGKRGLVLAHRDELIRQAADKLRATTGLECAIEKADECGHGTMWPVVVGSVQTLMRAKRLQRFSPDEFDVIITDEAHHSLATSYRSIYNYFPNAKMLGVTATPDRGDKKNLGQVYESLAFSYGLRQAIVDGHLARIEAQTIPLKVDLGNVKMKAGDYDENALDSAIAPYLDAIADEIATRAQNRKTLAFLPLRVTSRAFSDMLRTRGIDARHVDGASEDRAEVLAWLKSPGAKVCCNAMLLTEGFDEPSVDCIVNLRPTKSRSLYTQICGRGTRLYPGKDKLLLLDFLWQTVQHDLCRPCTLVAAREETAKIMTELQEEQSTQGFEQLDLLDLEKMANEEETRRRHEALAKQLQEQARKKARLLDPVMAGVIIQDNELADYEPTMRWEEAPPTDAQIKALERFGISTDAVKCKGHASALLGKMIERSKLRLASIGKLKVLSRYGFDGLGTITDKEANEIMNRLKSANWAQPERWSFR